MKFSKKDMVISLIFILFLIVAITTSNGSSYATFQKKGQISDVETKKWKVKVNGTNIVFRNKYKINALNQSNAENKYVKDGYITPGYTFEVPILIDAADSEVNVQYDFKIENNSQFTILGNYNTSKSVNAGEKINEIVTIKWKGTGNINNDKSLEGKNVDVPLCIYVRQLVN